MFSKRKKFISLTTNEGFDIIVNKDTIKYVERCPGDRENSIWVWTDWSTSGYFTVKESIESFRRKL